MNYCLSLKSSQWKCARLCGFSLSYICWSFAPMEKIMPRKNNCVYDKLVSFIASSPGKGRSPSQRVFLAGTSHVNHLKTQRYMKYLSSGLWWCPYIQFFSPALLTGALPLTLSQSTPALHLCFALSTTNRLAARDLCAPQPKLLCLWVWPWPSSTTPALWSDNMMTTSARRHVRWPLSCCEWHCPPSVIFWTPEPCCTALDEAFG